MGQRWTMTWVCAVVSCGPVVAGNDGSASEDSSATGDTTSDPSTSIGSSTTTDTTDTTDPTDPSTTSTTVADSSSDESAESGFPDFGTFIPDAPTGECTVRDPIGAEVNGYIWIANSSQSTVSKINVHTLVEEGRYLTRPDGAGNPSRTSVNRNGDVAVANRAGGVTMIRGNVELCADPNSTSTGPDDILPWPDGCIVWHTPMEYASQRPVAWTAGSIDPVACGYVDMDLWTAGANATIDVLLLDGETGAIEEIVPLPNVAAAYYGIYGAAVDSGNHFWGSQLGTGDLVRVDRDTFVAESWPMPEVGYGIAIDHNDRAWTCSSSAARFDYATTQWDVAQVSGGGGCAPGNDNIMWLANTPIVGVDVDTMQVVQMLTVPEYVHGVSMDFDGYVWGVALGGNAYRIDPVTGVVDTVGGLVNAYTYSDMTGTALAIISGQL